MADGTKPAPETILTVKSCDIHPSAILHVLLKIPIPNVSLEITDSV